jgi:hypothetical protein
MIHMGSLSRWLGICLIGFSTILPAQTGKKIKEIVIHSGWGGLGTPQDVTTTILATANGFQRDGKLLRPDLVQALLTAAEASPVSKPEPANLGITKGWLQAQLGPVEDHLQGKLGGATVRQKRLFESTFSDPEKISEILPALFRYGKSDDYPRLQVEIRFSDDSVLTLKSLSYYEFMLPWEMQSSENAKTYNANISRAISAILPVYATNQERLAGPELAFHLQHREGMEGNWC